MRLYMYLIQSRIHTSTCTHVFVSVQVITYLCDTQSCTYLYYTYIYVTTILLCICMSVHTLLYVSDTKLYAYLYVYWRIYIFACTYISTWHTVIRIYNTLVYMYVCTCTYICIWYNVVFISVHALTYIYLCMYLHIYREVGGWGRVPFSKKLMSPTPRRKW